MSHPQPTIPTFHPAPTRTEAETQEAKRLEKLQALGSSHHTAGTHEVSVPVAAASGDGVLRQLEAEGGER